jgi:potassium efflux system protein
MATMRLFVLSFLIVLCGFSSIGQNGSSDTTAPVINRIELSEISSARVELFQFLRQEVTPVLADSLMEERRRQTERLKGSVDSLAVLTAQILENGQITGTLEGLKLRWNDLDGQVGVLGAELASRNRKLEGIEKQLGKYNSAWELLLQEIEEEDSKEEIVGQIERTIDDLDSVYTLVDSEFDLSLSTEALVTEQVLKIEGQLKDIDNAKTRALFTRVMEREENFLNLHKDTTSASNVGLQALITLAEADVKMYLDQHQRRILWFFPLTILFLLFLYRMKKGLTLDDEIYSDRITKSLFQRPWLSSVFYGLLTLIGSLDDAPQLFVMTYVLLLLGTFIAVFIGHIKDEQKWVVLGVTFMYLIFKLGAFNVGPVGQRIFLLCVELALSFGLYRLWKTRTRYSSIKAWWVQLVILLAPFLLLLQLVSIVVNLVGYFVFAMLLTDGAITSLMGAIFVGLTFQSLTIAIRTWFGSGIPTYSHRWSEESREKAIRGMNRIIQITAIFLFARILMNGFYILDALELWWEGLLTVGMTVGDGKITIGNGLDFFGVLAVTWLVVGLFILFLREEVLMRLDLERGVPMAISSITNYTLVTFGIFLALSQLGFDFTNLGLLAGALGVGIGFGLQSIINNFLSGLIIVFERPITEGDIVKIQLDEGEVIRIGIRATTLRLYDSSELIVPNSDIVSQKVINWTLANKTRRLRFDFQLPLAGLDPERTVMLVADAMKKVIQSGNLPEPMVYYDGIDENRGKFFIHFWVERDILFTKNRVYTEIYRTLKAKDIGMIAPDMISLTQVDDHLYTEDKESEKESSITPDPEEPKQE